MHFHQKCIAPLTSVLRLTRVDMYHAVLYLRISILHSIVYSFRRSVGVPEREAAIHSDFQINIYPVSKQAGVYLVYTQHMVSLTAMEMAAAASARKPGTSRWPEGEMILKSPEMPMPSPVANNTTESSRAATHSMRSWP